LKYLITGGAGFVGSSLARTLLSTGHSVVVMDNGFKGSVDNLIELTKNPKFKFIWGDVTNKKDCERAITKDIDGIFHLAALVGAPVCEENLGLSYITNVDGTRNICDLKGHRRMVFCSTESVYGKQDGEYVESMIPSPSSNYAVQKYTAESKVVSCVNSVAFRFAAGMGLSCVPRINLLVNTLVYEAITNKCLVVYQPDVIRNFISVYDMVSCLIFGMSNHLNYKVYNAGSVSLTKRDIAEMIKTKVGCQVFYGDVHKDIDQRDGKLNCDRLLNEGFKVSIGMDETLDELIKGLPLVNIVHSYL